MGSYQSTSLVKSASNSGRGLGSTWLSLKHPSVSYLICCWSAQKKIQRKREKKIHRTFQVVRVPQFHISVSSHFRHLKHRWFEIMGHSMTEILSGLRIINAITLKSLRRIWRHNLTFSSSKTTESYGLNSDVVSPVVYKFVLQWSLFDWNLFSDFQLCAVFKMIAILSSIYSFFMVICQKIPVRSISCFKLKFF